MLLFGYEGKKKVYFLEEVSSEAVNKLLMFSSWENAHFNSAFKFHTLLLMVHKQRFPENIELP